MIHFIVNPQSGKGTGEKLWRKLQAVLDSRHVDYTVHMTVDKADTVAAARKCSGNILCAIGGDGTFHDVLNGADLARTAIGFIPNGRGNDFAFGTALQSDPFEALEAVLAGREKTIDYIDVSGIRCLNVAGTGLDVAVLKRVYDGQARTYFGSLVYNIKHFTPYRVKVHSDDGQFEGDCVMVGVCNGTQIGGGIRISPLSKIDDGKLNIVIMTMPEKRLMRSLLTFKKGKHMDMPYTRHFLTDRVEVDAPALPIQLDGEIYDVPLHCSVVKNGLRTFY